MCVPVRGGTSDVGVRARGAATTFGRPHLVAGYAWRPPGGGERADGLVDGGGEGLGVS